MFSNSGNDASSFFVLVEFSLFFTFCSGLVFLHKFLVDQINLLLSIHLGISYFQVWVGMSPVSLSSATYFFFPSSIPGFIIGFVNVSPHRLSCGVFPSAKEVLDISQITIAFHGVWPPLSTYIFVAILLTYLPLLVERLFQRCHLSRIDEVLKCGDSMKNLQTLSQIPSSSLHIQLSLLATAPRMLSFFFRLMWRFCFARIRWNPLSGKILYHDSALVIVSGFTSLIEDLVIRRCQVTKLFCVRWSFDSASSARGLLLFWFSSRHRNFWSFGKWV